MKKFMAICTLICVSGVAILQTSLADNNTLQDRIAETLSRYEDTKGDEMYVDDSDMSGFDTREAIKTVNALSSDISGVVAEIQTLQEQRNDNEESYQSMLAQVKRVIIDIAETKKTISDAVMKMNVLNKDIANTVRSLQDTRGYILESKESLSRLVELLYLVQNDYYGAGGESIDDIKLLLKSDNISDALSTDDLMNSLIVQFNTLIEDLTDHQTTYAAQYKSYNEMRADYKKTVIAYENRIQTLNEQKAYLMDFLKLYRSNKAVLNDQMKDLFQTRTQLKTKIAKIAKATAYQQFSEEFLASSGHQLFLTITDAREERRNFFLWPVLPVTNIDTYFTTS